MLSTLNKGSYKRMKKIKIEEKYVITRDGLRISANYFPGKKSAGKLLILAPGFAKFKDAYPMTQICAELTRYGDVLCVDFRGVAKARGAMVSGGKNTSTWNLF